MPKNSKQIKSQTSFYRAIAATLTIGGVSLLSPMLATAQTVAPLTRAGQTINNTATGTYQDPTDPTNTRINTTSNTVTATVAEVSGVTVVPAGLVDANGGSVTASDVVNYSFLITNVGNDFSAFHIPGTATVVGGAVTGSLTVTEVNGVVLATPFPIPAGGLDTTSPAFITAVGGAFNGSIPPNGTIKVQVPVTVSSTAVAGNPVSVTLGKTGTQTLADNNGALTQNQPNDGTTNSDVLNDADEVYTININTAPASTTTTPINGSREASAFQTVNVATQINSLALATVLKTRTAYSTVGTPALNDDLLSYRLDFRVDSTPPAGTTGISPAPLLGTNIRFTDGGSTAIVPKVLVSDAIPVGTVLDTDFAPIAPAGWKVVYSEAATTVSALDVTTAQNWTTTQPLATSIKRIGMVKDGPIAPGTTTVGDPSGLQFRVKTTGFTSGGVVANIAQAFGQTTAGAISPTNPLVYDESGDANPNNYEAGGAPTPITSVANPATTVPSGVADPVTQQTDNGNNNTGTGVNGEANIYALNQSGIILNGPSGQPGAIGPDNTTNTDFVNKSATDVPAGLNKDTPASSKYNPAAITFVNTVFNPIGNTDKLDNVILEPISAAKAEAATGKALTQYELTGTQNGAALIEGTTVRIAYPVGSTSVAGGTGRTALYTLTAGAFVLSSSTTNGVADGPAAPIKITSLAINQSQDYNVIIDLPPDSVVTTGYSVPVVAYVDSNPTSVGFKTVPSEDNPFNIKIDRVYTGFLNLSKLSRLLKGTGPDLSVAADGTFSITDKKPAPGNIIEYQIAYKNISTAATGSGNVTLDATKIEIIEDGVFSSVAPINNNNWADTTSNVPSTAVDATTNAVITYFNGAATSLTTELNVTKYVDKIPTLAPNASGIFTFQRKVK